MSVTIMAKNYAHCPLKKRPINFVFEEEPENLSTKPEDLSITGRLHSTSPSSTAESGSRSPISISSSPPRSPSPISYYHPELKIETSVHLPQMLNPEYAPQTWHRSIAPVYASGYSPYIPYAYPREYPAYGYPDSTMSPPHRIHHPTAIRPTTYSSIDQHSLSPNSSNTSSPPPQMENRNLAVRHDCPDCGKSYSTQSGLNKHRQFHCPAGDAPKKTFSCKHCEKVYTSLGALKMHIRTHTLPCKCDVCGKAFSRPWLLQGHIRTHTGEKPFSCDLCDRAFADRSNLRAHLQTHSEVKKYSCSRCNKTFSRMSLLTKHVEGGCSNVKPMCM